MVLNEVIKCLWKQKKGSGGDFYGEGSFSFIGSGCWVLYGGSARRPEIFESSDYRDRDVVRQRSRRAMRRINPQILQMAVSL
jgi:hypothetical protein